jgi:hypothetical protein
MMNLKAVSASSLRSIFSPEIAALSHIREHKNVNIGMLFAVINS